MKKLLSVLTCLFVLGPGTLAHADMWQYNSNSVGYQIYASIDGGAYSSLFASTFQMKDVATQNSMTVLCVQPDVYVQSVGQVEYNHTPGFFSDETMWLMRRLILVLAPQAMDNPGTSGLYWAALQTAIWEVARDGDNPFSLTEGNFRLHNYLGAGATAAEFSNLVVASYNIAKDPTSRLEGWADIQVWTSANSQNLLMYNYDRATTPIPAAAWLLGPGLAGLMALRRVKR